LFRQVPVFTNHYEAKFGPIINVYTFVSIAIPDTGVAFNYSIAPKEASWMINVITSPTMTIEVGSPMVIEWRSVMIVVRESGKRR